MLEANGLPRKIVIDKSGANTAGINTINKILKSFGSPIPIEMVRRKYLNNIVEQDHRFIKRRTRPLLGLKAFASASGTLDGIEVANMIRKGQFTPGICPFRQFAALAAWLPCNRLNSSSFPKDCNRTLRNLASAPLGLDADEFRISIVGAQEKTALLRYDGAWIRPSGFNPTTHILKTQLGVLPAGIDLSDSVENEYFCMSFCRVMGMEVAEIAIADFEDVRSLVVTRFDRRWAKNGRLIRLPQEDFCQALTFPPSQKYQLDSGPRIKEGVGLLAGSDDPEAGQRAFFRTQVLFWLFGATDRHAKNFSVALRPGGVRMTPLYDVLGAQKAVDDGQFRQNRMRLAMAVDVGRLPFMRYDQQIMLPLLT